MKYINQPHGPFKKTPFFDSSEIEKIALDDLRAQHLLPDRPGEVDIDSLVQKLFGFSPTYIDPGDGIMGYIRFGLRQPEVIIIHEALAEMSDDTNEHRRRSTLAHEIGHGRLHAGLYTELAQARKAGHATDRVRTPATAATVACRAGDIRDAEVLKGAALPTWERSLEWQANRYMAAVLVPARIVRIAVDELLDRTGGHTALALDEAQRRDLAPALSRVFNVSRQLAACRLAELFPEPDQRQGDLFSTVLDVPRAFRPAC